MLAAYIHNICTISMCAGLCIWFWCSSELVCTTRLVCTTATVGFVLFEFECAQQSSDRDALVLVEMALGTYIYFFFVFSCLFIMLYIICVLYWFYYYNIRECWMQFVIVGCTNESVRSCCVVEQRNILADRTCVSVCMAIVQIKV